MNEIKWHRIATDGLPEKDRRYLVVINNFNCKSIDVSRFATDLHTVDDYIFTEHKPGWYESDDEVGWYENTRISHWAELPDLPEDDDP